MKNVMTHAVRSIRSLYLVDCGTGEVHKGSLLHFYPVASSHPAAPPGRLVLACVLVA